MLLTATGNETGLMRTSQKAISQSMKLPLRLVASTPPEARMRQLAAEPFNCPCSDNRFTKRQAYFIRPQASSVSRDTRQFEHWIQYYRRK